MSDEIKEENVDLQSALDHPRIKARLELEACVRRTNTVGPGQVWCGLFSEVMEIENDCENLTAFGPCERITTCKTYLRARAALNAEKEASIVQTATAQTEIVNEVK